MTDQTTDTLRMAMRQLVDMAPAAPDMPAIKKQERVRRPVAAIAAGFGVVMVVLGLGTLVLTQDSGESQHPGGSDSAAATVVPTTETTTAATAVPAVVPAAPMTWDRIDDAVAFGGGDGVRLMTGIAVGEGIAVVVGADGGDGGGFFDAAVWYSVDGITWNRVPHDESVFGGDGHQRMNSVVAFESGFLAVGSDGDEPGAPGRTFPDENPDRSATTLSGPSETHAAVWRSDDGISWMRVPHVDAFTEADGGAVMNDVALGDSGLVAVGLVYGQVEPFATYRWGEEDPSAPRDVDIDTDAAVWTSVDGVSWSRVHAEDEAFGGDTIRQSMIAVTAGGPGFVAVGQEGFDFLGFDEWTPIPEMNTDGRDHVADNVAAVWTSPDGEIWTRVASDPSMAHSGGEVTGWATMFDIAPSTQGLVAVGRDVRVTGETRSSVRVREGAAVWLSPDGVTWHRAADVDTSGPDMHAVTVVDDGTLVAGGGMFIYGEAGTWISRDGGDTWVGFPNEDGLFNNGTIQGVAVFDDSVFAVGSLDGNASVWIGTVNDTDG